MLRLVLDWFNRHKSVEHELRFTQDARWYSEARIPPIFLARKRGDKLAESWTHADGAIGHFQIGDNGSGDLSLRDEASQFVVTEAKIFSKLAAYVTNADFFNQAARNVACMAEVLHRASTPPANFESLGFYVIAPESRIHEGIFSEYMGKDSMREVVQRRVGEYEDPQKDQWFDDWFLPILGAADIRCVSWEELLDVIEDNDPDEAPEFREFYMNCLKFNQFVAKRYP
ncbi:MAG: hypothetical protein ACYSUD_02335 [Planctomycetota bacterium]